jgi:hypothetical protein
MKKNTLLVKCAIPFLLFCSFSLTKLSAVAQAVCGPVVESYDHAGGSTAGFTGDFSFGNNLADGYLVKNRVSATGVYTITTPTYQLSNAASYIGYGFLLNGTERITRAEVVVMYVSTITREMTKFYLEQIEPVYGSAVPAYDVCRTVELAKLPGFPSGGMYRFRIELTANTGSGQSDQTITFNDFRTNGTIAAIPLPVSFLGFEAKKLANSIQLTWKVAGEENLLRYEVERSEDGHNFTTIGSVTRSGKDTYTYSDVNNSDLAYYRIRNIEKDGSYKFSSIARVANGKTEMVLKSFPQPVQNDFTLQHSTVTGRAFIHICTVDGHIVRSVIPATGSIQTTLNVSGLQAGIYMLRFGNGDGSLETVKMVKQ